MTNKTKNSVVKVIVRSDDRGDWIRPQTGDNFYIDEEAVFPDIEFEFKSDVPGPYRWTWTMKWAAQASGLSEKDRTGCATSYELMREGNDRGYRVIERGEKVRSVRYMLRGDTLVREPDYHKKGSTR